MVKYKYVMFLRNIVIQNKEKDGFTSREITDGPIRVMAEAEGYAMVKRKGCIPFVIKSKKVIRDKPAQ